MINSGSRVLRQSGNKMVFDNKLPGNSYGHFPPIHCESRTSSRGFGGEKDWHVGLLSI